MKTFIPYENREVDPEIYFSNILGFHSQNTPYWQKRLTPKRTDELISSSLEETLYNLSQLEVDQSLLRTDWLSFKPKNLKNAKCSFSSGTTGPQKFCMWSEDYVKNQINYIHYYISKQMKISNAIIQGPASVYKDVNEGVVNKFGGIPYFLPIPVGSIRKQELEYALKAGKEETIKLMKKYFGNVIENTRRFLERDKKINFMRSASVFLAYFEDLFGDRKLDGVMVSGLGYSPQQHEFLKTKFKNVFPSYGYFAFGDALGKYTNGNLDYYPAFPYAMFTVIREDGELAKYGEEGNPLFVIARPDLFLVLREANEYVVRAQPTDEFKWDGIRNPYRKL